MELSQLYKELIEDNTKAFVQTKEGDLLSLEQYKKTVSWSSWIAIYPGSFNPLHNGHKDIFLCIDDRYYNKMFETSITRWGKPELSLEDLKNRLEQFVGYSPIMITNITRFVEKTGLVRRYFQNIQFHIGMDTLKRMFENDYGLLAFQGIAADFVVHERIFDGHHETLANYFSDKKSPTNCIPGPRRSIESMSISSTQIRNKTTK